MVTRKRKRQFKKRRVNRQLPMPEMKRFDLISQSILVLSSGVFGPGPLNGCIVGDLNVNRTGNRIRIKKVGLRLQMAGSAVTDDGDVVRIIMYLDHQPNGVIPAVTDLLQTASVFAFRAAKTMKRFTILMDKFLDWGPKTLDVAGSGFATTRKAITFFKNVNIDVEYRLPSSTAIDAIGTNAIGMFAISGQADDTSLTYGSRVSFVDF